MEKKIIFEFLDGKIIEVNQEQKTNYLKTYNFERTDVQNQKDKFNYEYWYEVKEKPRNISHVDNLSRGTKFVLEFIDGHTETFNNYNSFENRNDDLKIKMNKKRTKLTYKGKTFDRRPDNLWVETSRKQSRGSKFILEFKDGHKEIYQNYSEYRKRTDDYKMIVSNKLYFQGKVFKKTAKNYWTEERDVRKKGYPVKFKLQYLNGIVLECENKSKFKPLTIEENMIYKDRPGLYYKGVWFVQDKNDKTLYSEKQDNFNIYTDKFYLLNDDKVYEFENMEYQAHREDEEKIIIRPLHIVDYFEYKPPHTNKKHVLVRRYMIYKTQVYYNIDNLKTWISLKNINKENKRLLNEEPKEKAFDEVVNHTNGNEIITFKKNGVYIFTPEKFQHNYKEYKENGGMVKFKSGLLCYYNNAVWEKVGDEWCYLRKAIDVEKANGKIIELKQEESFIINEINYLRSQGFNLHYQWAKCEYRQPNTISDEQRKKKVKNKSRAKRKKALQHKKKRIGTYKEKRGIVTYD